jgi:hypothetical protein
VDLFVSVFSLHFVIEAAPHADVVSALGVVLRKAGSNTLNRIGARESQVFEL